METGPHSLVCRFDDVRLGNREIENPNRKERVAIGILPTNAITGQLDRLARRAAPRCFACLEIPPFSHIAIFYKTIGK